MFYIIHDVLYSIKCRLSVLFSGRRSSSGSILYINYFYSIDFRWAVMPIG